MRSVVEEQVTAQDVAAQMIRLGFSDIRRFYVREGDTVRRLEPWELDRDEAAALHSIEVMREEVRYLGEGDDRRRVTETVIKLKLHDKMPALLALARHKGMLVEKAEAPGRLTLEAVLDEVNKLQAARRALLDAATVEADVVKRE